MPSHQKAATGGILHITVSHVLYPVTKEVLHQILDVYGVEKMSVFERGNHVEAMVQLQSWQEAKRARDAFHGRCIYEGCCFLDILLVQPTPDCASTTTARRGAEASALATEVIVDACSSPSDTHPADADEPMSEPVPSPSPDWDWEAMSDEQKDRCLRMVTELNEMPRNRFGWSTPSPTLCDAQATSTVNAPPVMILQRDTVPDSTHSSDLTSTPSGAAANYADCGNKLNRGCLLCLVTRCFEILLSPQDDDFDESAHVLVQLALIFAHTKKHPDEPPLLNAKSVRGIKSEDLATLKEKIDQEATENLGMAMVYTLVTSTKEWLSEKYGQNVGDEKPVETEEAEEEVIVPHGEAVTVESFLAWREIESQLLPIANASLYIQGNDVKAYLSTSPAAKPKFWLAFPVSVPPLGFKTDFVSSGKKSALSSMSTLYSSQGSKNSNLQVGQGHLKLQYDAARALSLHSDRKNLVEANFEQKYKYYIGQNRNGSDPQAFGAYIFRPNGTVPIKTDGQVPLTILRGHLFDPTMKSKPCFCIVLPGNGKTWKCLQFGSDGYGKRVDWTRLGIASEVVDTIEIALGVMSGRNGSSLTSMHRRQSSMLLIESDSWSSKMHVPLHIRLLVMKQKFCLKLALLATLPECYRGLNGRVVYIDTESKFSSWGLVEIGEKSFPQIFRQEGLAQKMAGRILVMRPTSLSDFTKSLEQMKVTLLQDDVKLLIVDSMAALMSSSMAEFSRIPVVVTNQVLSQSNDEGYHYSLEVEKKDDSNSAERLESDKLKVKNAVDSLITRPLKASILAACLFQALSIRESNKEKCDDSGSLHELLLGKNILVVDDNKLPWDLGGQTSKESAWGQAEFHRGKNVMNLGCRSRAGQHVNTSGLATWPKQLRLPSLHMKQGQQHGRIIRERTNHPQALLPPCILLFFWLFLPQCFFSNSQSPNAIFQS